jgi:hypothetical protein
MVIKMQSSEDPTTLRFNKWDTVIIGEALDDRGKAASDFAMSNANGVIRAYYHPLSLDIIINDQYFSADNLESVLGELSSQRILLETTTLGFVETYLFLKAIKSLEGVYVSLLYTEPLSYRIPRKEHILLKRDFDLSSEVGVFTGIPGAAILLRKGNARAVFLVGYEGQRLEQAFEQSQIKPSECSIVMGLPAFQPGWEMDTFANNIRIIKERQISDLYYTGAQNPLGAYNILNRIQESCRPGQRLLISPIGTKPHGIGTALFACDNDDVALLYDHPIRSKGRSKEISTWHLYDIIYT